MVAATFFACSKEKTAQRETTIEQQPKSPNDYTLAEMAEAMSWEDGKAFFENQTVKDYTAVCEMVLNDFGILFQFIFVYYLILQNKQKYYVIMTNKTSKNIRICCFVALAFCLVWAISTVFDITSNIFGDYASARPIDWSKNAVKKAVVLICYVVGSVSIIALIIKAIQNIFKGLRENPFFLLFFAFMYKVAADAVEENNLTV